MSRPNHHDANLFARDVRAGDDDYRAGTAQPVSQAEIEDLLFNEEISAPERLERLRALRDELAAMEAGDRGGHDPRAAIAEIDRAIEEIEGVETSGAVETSFDLDPADHRETLSPDDDELMDLLEAEDKEDDEDLDEVLDEEEWDDGDGFDPDKGVH